MIHHDNFLMFLADDVDEKLAYGRRFLSVWQDYIELKKDNRSWKSKKRPGDLYKCSMCNKRFPLKANLKRHYLIHTGEYPFICIVCKKRYRYADDLARHRKVHVELKDYACFCGKAYESISALDRHKSRHKSTDRIY